MNDLKESLGQWLDQNRVRDRAVEQSQHSQTNAEMGLKGGPNVIGLKRGDYVEVTVRYHDQSDPGRQGSVVRAWMTPQGNEWATVHFGKNRGGQNLRRKHPANTLKKILAPTGVHVERLKASQARTAERLQRQTVFKVMGLLRDASSMLNDIPPEGAEGAIRQAQRSIEAARLKLNSVTSKFQESDSGNQGKGTQV